MNADEKKKTKEKKRKKTALHTPHVVSGEVILIFAKSSMGSKTKMRRRASLMMGGRGREVV
jgi:hypothetical protein